MHITSLCVNRGLIVKILQDKNTGQEWHLYANADVPDLIAEGKLPATLTDVVIARPSRYHEWINGAWALDSSAAALEYKALRAFEYPPVTDYLDAVVKGDLVAQQAYIDACLAVKAKYPKP